MSGAPSEEEQDITRKLEEPQDAPAAGSRGSTIAIQFIRPPAAALQARAELQQPEQQFVAVVATQPDGPPPYVAQYVPWERNSPGAVRAAVQGVPLSVQPHNPFQQPEVPVPMVAPIPLQPLPGARPAEVEPLVLSLARTLKWCSILDLLFLLLYGFLDFLFFFLLPLPLIGYLGAQRLHRPFTAAYMILLVCLIGLRVLLIVFDDHVWIQVLYGSVIVFEIWFLRIAFSFFQQVGSLTDEERNMFMTQEYLPTGTILLW